MAIEDLIGRGDAEGAWRDRLAGVHPAAYAVATAPVAFLIVVMASIAFLGEPGRSADAPVAATPVLETLSQPPASTPPRAHGVTPAAFAAVPASIDLDPDASIAALGLDGARLALHVNGPAGREIIVYDMDAGRVVHRIDVRAINRQQAAKTDIAPRRAAPPANFVLHAPSLSPAR